MSNQEPKLKVCYEKEIHLIPIETSYFSLRENIQSSFVGKLPNDFKLFYVDFEGDIISITTQDDMDEALNFIKSSGYTIKVIIDVNTELVRKSIVEGNYGKLNLNQNSINLSNIKENINKFQDSEKKELNTSNKLPTNEILSPTISKLEGNETGKNIDKSTEKNQNIPTEKLPQILEDATQNENKRKESGQNNLSTQNIPSFKEEKFNSNMLEEAKKIASSSFEHQPLFEIKPKNVQEKGPGNVIQKIKEINDEEEVYVCFKCQGKGKNDNGDNCPICFGHGNLPNSWAEPLFNMIQTEVSKAVQSVLKSEMQSLRESIRLEKSNIQTTEGPIHNNIRCNICKALPIKGIRYKCPVCDDFDICENCEYTKGHQHALLKIRNSESQGAPIKVISHNNKINPPNVVLEPKQVVYKKEEEKIYYARFIKDDPKDAIEATPGQKIKKSWTLRNEGAIAWPSTSKIVMVGGDDLGGQELDIGEVLPGMEKTITQNLKAPTIPGKYNQFFRISYISPDGQTKRFGHRVWVDVIVKEGNDANAKNEIKKDNSFVKKKEESEDKIVEALKSLTKLNLEKEYEDNAIKLIHMGILDVNFIVDSLKFNNNNVQAVTEIFFNK